MIYIERKIIIKKNQAQIEEPIVLYKGDMNIELQFIIENNPFKYKPSMDPTYGQLVIKRENTAPIFSESVKMSSNRVLFTVTGDMIDELDELGNYDFQIRLLNSDNTSRGTLPPVLAGITIKEPICEEAAANTTYVNNSSAFVMPANNVSTFALRNTNDVFDEDGNYNKTNWVGGDIITDARLNKVEEALYQINDSVPTDYSTIRYVDESISDVENYIDNTVSLESRQLKEYMNDNYSTQDYVNTAISNSNDVNRDYVDDMIANIEAPEVDLTGYATESFVNESIANIDIPEVDLTGYATTNSVVNMISDNNSYLEGYVADNYATQDYVDKAIEDIELMPGLQGEPGPQGPMGPQGPAGKDADPADLTGYATEEYVNNVLGDIEDLLGGI